MLLKNNIASLLFFLIGLAGFAQVPDFSETPKQDTTSNEVYVIKTNDGGIFTGTIEDKNDREVTVLTKDKGRVIIPKYAIRSMQVKDQVVSTKDTTGVYENDFDQRYCLTNSAMPIPAGRWNFNSQYAVAWTCNYGISENFAVGLSGLGFLPFMINSKSSMKIGHNLYLGHNLDFGFFYPLESIWFGYGSLKITSGTKDRNSTFGIGVLGAYEVGYYQSFNGFYAANWGSMIRLKKTLLLVTDLIALLPSDNRDNPAYLVMIGLRPLSFKKAAFTISLTGLVLPSTRTSGGGPGSWNYETYYRVYPIPVMGFSYRF